MANRRFEMHHYRQALLRMRQGESDRRIADDKLMGRPRAATLRRLAAERGWLDPDAALPDDATPRRRLRVAQDSPQAGRPGLLPRAAPGARQHLDRRRR